MQAATTPVVPTPEGTEPGFVVAVFYCRESDFDAVAERLAEQKGAEVERRFNPRTGEPEKGQIKWDENGIKFSVSVAPPFHRLYGDPE